MRIVLCSVVLSFVFMSAPIAAYSTQTITVSHDLGGSKVLHPLAGIQVFDTKGANTYTKTTGVSLIRIRMVGGGGGGGQGNSSGWAATGGGGGGYCEHWVVVTDTPSFSLIVGGGGAGGASNCSSGADGDNSSISLLGLEAEGGGRGECPPVSQGDIGGAGGDGSVGSTTCDIEANGGAGLHMFSGVNYGTDGGSSYFGGAGRGSFDGNVGNGSRGGGGGGGRSTGSTSGAGGDGIVIIEEYY